MTEALLGRAVTGSTPHASPPGSNSTLPSALDIRLDNRSPQQKLCTTLRGVLHQAGVTTKGCGGRCRERNALHAPCSSSR